MGKILLIIRHVTVRGVLIDTNQTGSSIPSGIFSITQHTSEQQYK